MESGVTVIRARGVGNGNRRGAGFTLVELMVALTVVAAIAAIAYPTYQDQMRKGRRAAAQAFLVDAASRQQQYLIDARTYAVGDGAIAALSLGIPPEVASYYTVSVEPAAATNPPTYRLLATPIAGSSQAPDGNLTLDQDGAKTRKGQAGW
jgi:type IV pilus assembly protein PilE